MREFDAGGGMDEQHSSSLTSSVWASTKSCFCCLGLKGGQQTENKDGAEEAVEEEEEEEEEKQKCPSKFLKIRKIPLSYLSRLEGDVNYGIYRSNGA